MRRRVWIIALLVGTIASLLYLSQLKRQLLNESFALETIYSTSPLLADRTEYPIVLQSLGSIAGLEYVLEVIPFFSGEGAEPQLRLEHDGEEELLPLERLAHISIGVEDFRVSSMTGLNGIKPDGRGTPYLSMNYLPDTTLDRIDEIPLTVADGDAVEIHDIHCSFFWGPGDIDNDLIPAARWGIKDGVNVSWFNDLRPGSGIELSDGTEVMLLNVNPDASEIEILIERNDMKKRRTVLANTVLELDDIRVYFDNAMVRERVLICSTETPGRMKTRYFENGVLVLEENLQEHDTLTFSRGDGFKLMSILPKALPINGSWAPWLQVVLENDEQRLVVRQGERIFVGDHQVSLLGFAANEVSEVGLHFQANGKLFHERVPLGEWSPVIETEVGTISAMVRVNDGRLRPELKID